MKKKYLAAGAGLGAVGGLIAWKFMSRASEIVWDEVSEFVPHSANSHFAEVDGLRVHFQEFGERNNPTLVLIHGYTSSVVVWKTVAPRFAENNFHVVAVDLIGFGYSSKPAWFDYTIASQARIISRLMNRLGIGKATILGSSYGGAVASTLALDYAERVEKLVLVDAVINDEPKNHPILKLARIRGIGEILSPFLLDSKMFMRRRMRETLYKKNHHLITRDRIESIRRPLNAADGHHSVLQTGRNWDANRIEADAHLINQSTLIIWGENDMVIPIRSGEKLYDAILHSRFVVFENCGHVPQEEKSDDFVNVVTEFLSEKKQNSGNPTR
ncbi:MAG: alpha/beta fold hydrolase [Pyrinomonadaceae bacterium]